MRHLGKEPATSAPQAKTPWKVEGDRTRQNRSVGGASASPALPPLPHPEEATLPHCFIARPCSSFTYHPKQEVSGKKSSRFQSSWPNIILSKRSQRHLKTLSGPAEAWVSSGLLQGQGLWVQQAWVRHKPSWRRLEVSPP